MSTTEGLFTRGAEVDDGDGDDYRNLKRRLKWQTSECCDESLKMIARSYAADRIDEKQRRELRNFVEEMRRDLPSARNPAETIEDLQQATEDLRLYEQELSELRGSANDNDETDGDGDDLDVELQEAQKKNVAAGVPSFTLGTDVLGDSRPPARTARGAKRAPVASSKKQKRKAKPLDPSDFAGKSPLSMSSVIEKGFE